MSEEHDSPPKRAKAPTMLRTPLADRPDIAQRVGEYIASFTLTESMLAAAFARVIGDNGKITHAVLHHFRTVSDRVTVFVDVLEAADHPRKDELLRILSRVRNAANYRNELAHGLFGLTNDGGILLTSGVTAKQKKTAEIAITVDGMDQKLREISTLNLALQRIGFPPPTA